MNVPLKCVSPRPSSLPQSDDLFIGHHVMAGWCHNIRLLIQVQIEIDGWFTLRFHVIYKASSSVRFKLGNETTNAHVTRILHLICARKIFLKEKKILPNFNFRTFCDTSSALNIHMISNSVLLGLHACTQCAEVVTLSHWIWPKSFVAKQSSEIAVIHGNQLVHDFGLYRPHNCLERMSRCTDRARSSFLCFPPSCLVPRAVPGQDLMNANEQKRWWLLES